MIQKENNGHISVVKTKGGRVGVAKTLVGRSTAEDITAWRAWNEFKSITFNKMQCVNGLELVVVKNPLHVDLNVVIGVSLC